jgi:hypothetical protein
MSRTCVSSSYSALARADEFNDAERLATVVVSSRKTVMKRIWSIEEQSFADNASGLTFTFASEPTELDDTKLVLHVDSGSGRKLIIEFERNGQKTGSDVVGTPPATPSRDGHPELAVPGSDQTDGLAASLQL